MNVDGVSGVVAFENDHIIHEEKVLVPKWLTVVLGEEMAMCVYLES